jgi:hypothetical protein
MLTELTKLAIHDGTRRLREQHLAAMPRAHDPRREMHVLADVVRWIHKRLTRMHANTNSHRPLSESLGHLAHPSDRRRSRPEREEERIALLTDLVPAMLSKRSTDDPPVLDKRFSVRLRP